MEQDTTTERQLLTVAQVAQLAGVTVRTLHHYDTIGLLAPSARSDANYRLYADADIARLRELLVWRRLGLTLEQVARLLDDPEADRRAVLQRQRELVGEQIEEMLELAAALDRALADTRGDDLMNDRAIIDALDGFDPADHVAEAQQRWGDSDSYRESARRTSTYGPEEWRRIKSEADAIHARLVELFETGADPSSDEVVAQAEASRAHTSRYYYECSPAYLRGHGDMFVADPRFRAHYEGEHGQRPGMAEWVRDAWHARADRG